ncbi:hypothetical protein CBS63078_3065 [Aspergillus niger]|nr:hypothetical protein CBS133816_338 [Aspergillus niger]KAI2852183.1 hypothetical protein CBS11350_661 [Aspergillus niger]KAI2903277.1 hypothetical protein CBS13152_1007 [Aspergillus niger]KAI2915455.1 hypothetical protein CBS147371_5740 [Aspergillus niger]KAI2918503.1 hypothetical protein CBS63078_3065 [Aspergillus niger]
MTESGIYGVTGVEPEAGYQENGWSDLSTDLRQKMDCFHRLVVASLKCHVWATWREFPDGRIQRHLGSDTSIVIGSADFEKDHLADYSVELLVIDSRVVAYEIPPMRGSTVEHQQQLTPSRPCANPDVGTR